MAQALATKVVLITGASAVPATCGAPEVIALPVDLRQPEANEAMVTDTLAHFCHLDILLANAGLYTPGDVAEAALFMLTWPPHVTTGDLVILPQNQDI